MGAGGRMSDSSKHEVKDILKRVPVDPPFSLSDLKKAIPAHCFERSVIRSSYYVVYCFAKAIILTVLWLLVTDVDCAIIIAAYLALLYAVKLSCEPAKGAALGLPYPRALSTIDRDFGFLNRVFHDVTHTHVLHHLISYIPHYHAKEARDAIKPVLGEFYKIDRTPILKQCGESQRNAIYLEPEVG
ncbi:plastid delta12-fatty acid acetylenase [Tanacetum coccineum]